MTKDWYMPKVKHVELRYQILNRCFRNRYREYTLPQFHINDEERNKIEDAIYVLSRENTSNEQEIHRKKHQNS